MPYTLEAPEDPKLGLVTEMLRSRGTVHFKAWGSSMLPSVWPGDVITTQSAAPHEVRPGDIVLVLRDSRFFVHRLVARRLIQDRLLWIMRGDAMPHDDPPIAASALLGRVASIRRANRSFVPSRRVSLFHFALAWMLCRCDRFRNLMLKVHAARLRAAPTSAGEFFRVASGLRRRISGTSPSPTSHP